MKMSKLTYALIVVAFERQVDIIKDHREALKRSGKFNSLPVRLAFDSYYAVVPPFVKKKVQAEELTDRHLQTGLVKALKEALGE